jgi:hypothetical protein
LQRNNLLISGRYSNVTWSRNGELTGNIGLRMEASRLFLSYRHSSHGSEWQSQDYPIVIDWTPCHYGGERAWFLCPARGCGRRVAILYGGKIFACRRCYRLAYESQTESAAYRALSRTQKIRMRLGGSGSMMDFFPEKPKGMHWKTYRRLEVQGEWYERIANQSMMAWIDGRRKSRVSMG